MSPGVKQTFEIFTISVESGFSFERDFELYLFRVAVFLRFLVAEQTLELVTEPDISEKLEIDFTFLLCPGVRFLDMEE